MISFFSTFCDACFGRTPERADTNSDCSEKARESVTWTLQQSSLYAVSMSPLSSRLSIELASPPTAHLSTILHQSEQTPFSLQPGLSTSSPVKDKRSRQRGLIQVDDHTPPQAFMMGSQSGGIGARGWQFPTPPLSPTPTRPSKEEVERETRILQRQKRQKRAARKQWRRRRLLLESQLCRLDPVHFSH
jgi:hypothetical protein